MLSFLSNFILIQYTLLNNRHDLEQQDPVSNFNEILIKLAVRFLILLCYKYNLYVSTQSMKQWYIAELSE